MSTTTEMRAVRESGGHTAHRASELDELLTAVFEKYGFDFRDYARASTRRRVHSRVTAEGLPSISALTKQVLEDRACMERLLLALTVHVTSLFRDPGFYRAFRQKVVPVLRASKFTRIWHAGCSSGEEPYSMAILLREEGLADRCRIYATDLSEVVTRKAIDGVFALDRLDEYSENYSKAGGKRTLTDYCSTGYGHAVFEASLRQSIVFAQHNLVTDNAFNEFDVVLCRNVLIYFNPALQGRVHRLLYQSLAPGGFFGLGHRESVRFTPHEEQYTPVDDAQRIYRRSF
jgi:chemotaxis protein methyltransferase CheR